MLVAVVGDGFFGSLTWIVVTRKPAQGLAVGYARVSSGRQRGDGDLDRQVVRLRAWAGGELSVITDIASGLSDRRAGLRKCWASV